MKKFTDTFNAWDGLIVSIILLIALTVRLYDVTKPLTDFHSWRQADTAAVGRNFVRNGFNLLKPQYDDLSPIQTGHDNPQGLRFVEFPLYNATFAGLYKILPIYEVHVWGRLVTIWSSLILLAIIYYFLRREADQKAAIAGSLSFALFPFIIYYTRVVLPETMATMLTFASIFFLYKFTFDDKKTPLINTLLIFLSAVFFALALLVKPTTVFFGIVHVYLFYKKFKLGFLKDIRTYIFGAIVIVPLLLWRKYISAYPEGIPASDWLFTSVNTPQGLQNIFFRPAFFRWIFFERINNLILGGFGAAFFVLGVLVKQKRLFLHMILAASFLYVFVFQGGNVQHEYYQTLIFPALAIFVGLGISFILNLPRNFLSPFIIYPAILGIMLFSMVVSYEKVKDYYSYSSDLVNMARIIDTLTKPDDKLVTDTTGDTTLLYLTDRRGAPAVFKGLPELRDKGYNYFVTMNGQVIEAVKKETKFQVVFENDKFALFKL